jgi:hypothetical protein
MGELEKWRIEYNEWRPHTCDVQFRDCLAAVYRERIFGCDYASSNYQVAAKFRRTTLNMKTKIIALDTKKDLWRLTFLSSVCCLLTVWSDVAPAVINGIPTNEIPFVTQVFLPGGELCTAAAVSSTKVLTAAHCLPAPACLGESDVHSSRIIVQGRDRNYTAKRVSCLDLYMKSFMKSKFDVAIIELSGPHGLPIAQFGSMPSIKDKVYVVGFGASGFSTKKNGNSVEIKQLGGGRKRFGSNHIYQIKDDTIRLQGRSSNKSILGFEKIGSIEFVDGTDAMPFVGDSGGPLLNELGEIIGVTSTSKSKYFEVLRVLRIESPVYAMTTNDDVSNFIAAELNRPD